MLHEGIVVAVGADIGEKGKFKHAVVACHGLEDLSEQKKENHTGIKQVDIIT